MISASEETYRDVELMIHDVTHRFLRTRGISERDYEEWHGEALAAFASAYSSYRPEGASGRRRFTTWLWHCVWNGLAEKQRSEAPHHETAHLRKSELRDLIVTDGHKQRWQEFVASLSDDARTVVRLTTNISSRRFAEPTQMERSEMRLLVFCLLQDVGWACERIVESFREIRRALLD